MQLFIRTSTTYLIRHLKINYNFSIIILGAIASTV